MDYHNRTPGAQTGNGSGRARLFETLLIKAASLDPQAMLAARVGGDQREVALLSVCADYLKIIKKDGKSRLPRLCVAAPCEAELRSERDVAAMLVMMPIGRQGGGKSVASGVCHECMTRWLKLSPPALQAETLKIARAVATDARVILAPHGVDVERPAGSG